MYSERTIVGEKWGDAQEQRHMAVCRAAKYITSLRPNTPFSRHHSKIVFSMYLSIISISTNSHTNCRYDRLRSTKLSYRAMCKGRGLFRYKRTTIINVEVSRLTTTPSHSLHTHRQSQIRDAKDTAVTFAWLLVNSYYCLRERLPTRCAHRKETW